MENIDKTVKSKYPPKQKNVNWIDTSGDKPEMKTFFNGKWSSVGGSSVDSTNLTEDDVNKVWQVTPIQKGTKIKETVIVPEQTCNMEGDGKYTICTLQNVDESCGPGFSGIAILDGNEYSVEWLEGNASFYITESVFIGHIETDNFELADSNLGLTHTIKVITRETEPLYDYNWAPGVKIPIPTAEDEGKILVVTETEGNTFTIVPEQPVPINININEATPLTDVDLTKFVAGNTVKVTITPEENNDDGNDDTPVPGHLPDYSGPVSESGPAAESEQGGSSEQGDSPGTSIPIHKPTISQTVTVTGVIEEHEGMVGVPFNINDNILAVWQEDNSLYTDAVIVFGTNITIKLEYIESNYEYQLQENLPSMTNDDIGKVLTVSEEPTGEIQTVTIIPEQVAVEYEFTNCNTEYFKEGTLVKLYVDGELEYEGPVLKDYYLYVGAEYDGQDYNMYIYLENGVLHNGSLAPYTQSTFFMTAEIPQTQPKAIWSNPSSGGFSWPVVPLVRRTPTQEDLAKFAEISVEVNTAIDLNKKGELPNPLIIDVGNSEYQVFTLCSVYNGYWEEEPYESGYAVYMYKAGEDHFVEIDFFVDPEATVMLARM